MTTRIERQDFPVFGTEDYPWVGGPHSGDPDATLHVFYHTVVPDNWGEDGDSEPDPIGPGHQAMIGSIDDKRALEGLVERGLDASIIDLRWYEIEEDAEGTG